MAIEIVSCPIKNGGSFHSLLAKDHPISMQKRIIAFLGLMAQLMAVKMGYTGIAQK